MKKYISVVVFILMIILFKYKQYHNHLKYIDDRFLTITAVTIDLCSSLNNVEIEHDISINNIKSHIVNSYMLEEKDITVKKLKKGEFIVYLNSYNQKDNHLDNVIDALYWFDNSLVNSTLKEKKKLFPKFTFWSFLVHGSPDILVYDSRVNTCDEWK